MRADARLALPAVGAWAILGVLLGSPDLLPPAAVVLGMAAAGALAWAILSGRARALSAGTALLAGMAAILVAGAALAGSARHPAELVEAAEDGRAVTVVAHLDAVVRAGASAGPVPVTVVSASVGETTSTGLAIPVLAFGPLPEGGIGTTIEASGTLALAEPGERIAFLLFARGSPEVTGVAPWYLDWANGLRDGFHATAATLPGDGGDLLPGLAIGDTSAVDPVLDDAMKATALSHLTAVSGANCAIVVGLVMAVGAAIGLSRGTRVGLSLVVLAGFVVLVTPDASVLRAAVMAAVVLVTLASGRPSRGAPVLALAIVILLGIDPWLSRDFGFILSVLATAALLVLAGPLARILARWMPAPLATLVSIPLAAQLACQPVLILLNPAVPAYGVIANLLCEPAAPVGTVLGLVACILLPVLPPLGTLAAQLAWLPAAWIAAVARFLSGLPGAQLPWAASLPGVGLLILLTGATVALVLRGGSARSAFDRILAGSLVTALVVYAAALTGSWIGQRLSVPRGWQIAACDVGQGDAVLVRSGTEVALIDTGPDPEPLADCLDELGVGRIGLLVLSHYDLDHVGGTAAVLGRVDRAIVGPVSDATDETLRASLVAAGAEVDEVTDGASGMLGELRWRVLWPPKRLGTVPPGNAASVTVRFEGVGACVTGCLSALFLGDLGEESQSRLLSTARPSPVDVVKVAHHGSADQSERLYERIRARVGVISVGADNRYGHPTDRLLGILRTAGTTIARTDLEGLVLLSPAPDGGIRVWTRHPADRDVGAH